MEISSNVNDSLEDVNDYNALHTDTKLQDIEPEVEIKQTHTICKGCCFAEVRHDYLQTGCSLGRLETFGNIVVEANDETDSFYVINGRHCNAKRSQKWVERQTGDLKEAVYAELRPTLTLLVYLDEDVSEVFGRLKSTFDNLKEQTVPFEKVIFISNQMKISRFDIVNRLREIGEGINWSLYQVLETNKDGSRVDHWRCIDLVFNQIKSTHYLVIDIGSYVPKEFTENLDYFLNIRLQQFNVGILLDISESPTHYQIPYLLQTKLHEMVNGSVPAMTENDEVLSNVLDKVLDIAQQTETEKMVKDLEDFCDV